MRPPLHRRLMVLAISLALCTPPPASPRVFLLLRHHRLLYFSPLYKHTYIYTHAQPLSLSISRKGRLAQRQPWDKLAPCSTPLSPRAPHTRYQSTVALVGCCGSATTICGPPKSCRGLRPRIDAEPTAE